MTIKKTKNMLMVSILYYGIIGLIALTIYSCQKTVDESQLDESDYYKILIKENRVKSKKTYCYNYVFGVPDSSSKYLTDSFDFDKNGNMQMNYHLYRFGSSNYIYLIDYFYNEQSVLTKSQTKDSNGQKTMSHIYKYDNGRNIEILYLESNGKILYKKLNRFDKKGNLENSIFYDSSGNLNSKSKITRSYPKKDYIEMVYNEEGMVTDSNLFYSRGDSLFREEHYFYEGVKRQTTISKLNNNLQPFEIRYVDFDTEYSNGSETNFYKYDKRGLLKERIKYNFLNEPIKLYLVEYVYYEE